jgi:hypothetical protein
MLLCVCGSSPACMDGLCIVRDVWITMIVCDGGYGGGATVAGRARDEFGAVMAAVPDTPQVRSRGVGQWSSWRQRRPTLTFDYLPAP